MATGLPSSKENLKGSKLAKSKLDEDLLLPIASSTVFLDYKNKIERAALLNKKFECRFDQLSEKHEISECHHISTNSLILADNLSALNKLISSHKNKINLIYLDPPYGTGFDFQSRKQKHAYQDNFSTPVWLEFMRRRLIFMHELLADNGSIYIHIGHQMLFHLKIIMDEIFGEKNFKNLITRRKCSSKNYTKNQYPNVNDYILFYSKSNNYTWNRPGMPASKEWINKEYNKVDNKGRYKLVPIHAPGVRNGETGKEWKGMLPPEGKHWQMKPSKLDDLDEKGHIHWSKNNNPRRKVYLPENKELPLTDYWDHYRDAHHQSIKITGYPTEKNMDMLKKIIFASSNEGDLVLDPFCGSGTTLHAASEMNRQWIGIDQSFLAIETTMSRLLNGLEPMGDFVNKNQKETIKQENIWDTKVNFVVDSKTLQSNIKEVTKISRLRA